MLEWDVIDTGKNTAKRNMELDRELLDSLRQRPKPLLHLYDWEGPAATYGHFLDPRDHLHDTSKLDLAKRPTGGGLLFHTCDLAFSVLLPTGHPADSPNTLERYRWVNKRVAEAIRQFGSVDAQLLSQQTPGPFNFCMAKPTVYDIVIGKKKVGGAAQRKKRWGLLHQGTISLGTPRQDFLQSVLRDSEVAAAMESTAYPLLGTGWTQVELKEARRELRRLLAKVFSQENE